MEQFLLAILALTAIGVSAYFGYALAKANQDVAKSHDELRVKSAAIYAMKRAVEHQAEIWQKLNAISNAKTMDELNKLYNDILGSE